MPPITREEENLRAAIIDCCSRLWRRGLVTGSSGNVSARLRQGDILVTPSGESLERLAVDAIVHTDPDGVPRNTGQRPSSELPLHIAAYASRGDARVLVHTHPTYCVVSSMSGRLFTRESVGARESLGEIGWVGYEAPGSVLLANRSAEVFARGVDVLVMERHGLSCIAADFERAFLLSDLAEEAARIAYLTVGQEARHERQGEIVGYEECRGMPPHRLIR